MRVVVVKMHVGAVYVIGGHNSGCEVVGRW